MVSVTALLIALIFPVCLIVGALSDIATMTIPNRLCLGIAAGFPVAAVIVGMPLDLFLLSMGLGLAMLFLGFALFAAGTIGGGDAKLLAATALWVGPHGAGDFLVVTTLAGAALALVMLALRSVCQPATGYAFADRLLSKETGLPYGVAICAGGLFAFSGGYFAQLAGPLF